MKRLRTLVLVLVALSLPAAGVAAQGAATPGATPDAAAVDLPGVEYIDENGIVLAVFTVTAVERAWTGSAESFAPQAGNEYVRVTVAVESRVGRGIFTVEPFFFYLQDADGFIAQANPIPTAEEAAAGFDPFASILELPGGETGELQLTFELLGGVDLQALYFSPDLYSRLVTLAEFDEAS